MDENNIEDGQKAECSISSNDLFTKIYHISQTILHHLPIRSVECCSLVCQSWAEIARNIKVRRHTIHTLTYPSDLMLPIKSCSINSSDFDAWISTYMNNDLWSLPYLALVVTTKDLDRKGFLSSSASCSPPPMKNSKRSRSQITACQEEHITVPQTLFRHLNKSCKLLQVASEGIVVSNGNKQCCEIELGNAMGILLFPKFPSNILGIYPFEIPYKTKIPKNMSRADLHHLLGDVPDDIPIRCVIFFFTQRQSHSVHCIRKLLEHYPSDIVIIGGFADRIHYDDRQNQSYSSPYNTCGIVLTGDPARLNIRQVVLEDFVNTREAIRNRLNELKSNENDRCLSFAIQISCIARGSEFYNGEQNVECSEFRNLFPETPLIGIFGNGEIGHDYLPNKNSTSQQESTTVDDIFHTYSTVYSLISLRM